MANKIPLKLAIFDIDGTLRRVRDPWIHLHEHLGVAAEARDLPDLWHRGEISYEQWARLDASLWRGSPHATIVAALESNPFREGARELVGWFTGRSIPCVGISTGLSVFNDVTAHELGMEEIICNELHFDGNICSGEVFVRVGEGTKAQVMDQVLHHYDIDVEHVVAFGDGTADIPLLTRASLGIAICPKNDGVRACAEHVVEAEPIDSAINIVEKHFGMDATGKYS
jgi:phosphoserine phosphatase